MTGVDILMMFSVLLVNTVHAERYSGTMPWRQGWSVVIAIRNWITR